MAARLRILELPIKRSELSHQSAPRHRYVVTVPLFDV